MCHCTHSICAIRNSFVSWRTPGRVKLLLWWFIRNSKYKSVSDVTYTASTTSLAICMREHVAAKVREIWLGGSFSLGGQLPKNGSKFELGVTKGTGMA